MQVVEMPARRETHDQKQIEIAFNTARSLGLKPEEITVSKIDDRNWVGTVGCDGCIAVFIQVKAGMIADTRVW